MASPKKKLTKKELKALNHAKLMSEKGGGGMIPTQNEFKPNNVIKLDDHRPIQQVDKQKKAS